MALGEVRALLFDMFGTVVDWRGGITRAAAGFLAARGCTDIDPAGFADAWRRLYQPAMQQVRGGARPFTRLDVLHRENLFQVLRDHGIDPDAVPPAEIDGLNGAWHRLDPWPDAVQGLTRLRWGFIVAPLSNANVALALDVAKRAGLPWDAILGAEVVQAYKPSPEAYLRTADLLGLPPAACCMVAAHNADLRAARDCGFHTAFVARPLEHGAGQTTDLVAEEAWDIVAADFNDLAARLDR